MEFTIAAPLGAQANLIANSPARKAPDTSKVEATPNAGKARADLHNSAKQHDPAQDRRHLAPSALEDDVSPDTLAGPPPSFRLNLLELDQKLQQQLARIETQRTHARMLNDTIPHPTADEPL
ncbi:hypothetical protein [Aliiroseovarius sediminis]|uniref:hypothetical protein n=1 Tax=Aliiroseovarius sediminis TaxID=2925839 RepID=UPI001F5AA84E|nr:hypothetical protein [Aliiroseovarius sediminis]MCI2394002.1 hypothetical protein [Aliiroseovarius sediminis]